MDCEFDDTMILKAYEVSRVIRHTFNTEAHIVLFKFPIKALKGTDVH